MFAIFSTLYNWFIFISLTNVFQVNMATNMAASSIIGSTKNGGVDANNDEVEFMSTSSDSSSSGEST